MNKVKESHFKIQFPLKDFITINFIDQLEKVLAHSVITKLIRPQKLKHHLFFSTLVGIKKVLQVHLEHKKTIKNSNLQLKEVKN